MIAYARHHFKLDKPNKDGSCERQHLESLQRQLKVELPELRGPEFPGAVAHIWSWFSELRGTAGCNGMGLNAISHGEIRAWQENTGNKARPWEIGVIVHLDRVYREIMGSQSND